MTTFATGHGTAGATAAGLNPGAETGVLASLAAEKVAKTSDDLLLERFARGDQRAFALIVQRYTDAVYGTCLRVLRDPARADDATQETFFRLMRSPESVEQSLGGWLHRAATTISIDCLRHEKRLQAWEREHQARRQLDPQQPTAEETVSWQEVAPQLDAALNELSEDDRWLLVQHYLRGRAIRTLAKETGTSAPTLSRRHQAALAKLKEKLQARGVVASLTVLGILLVQNAAVAAPPCVHQGLGKITLFHAASSQGSLAAALGLTTRAASAVVAMAVVVIVSGLIVASGLLPSAQAREPDDRRTPTPYVTRADVLAWPQP